MLGNANPVIQDWGYVEISAIIVGVSAFAYLFLFYFPDKYVTMSKFGYPFYGKLISKKRISKWRLVDAVIVRSDFANQEGGNPVATKELSNFTGSLSFNISPTVLVVEYLNEITDKNIPVTIPADIKPRLVGDKIKIRVNPENPLEAVLAE